MKTNFPLIHTITHNGISVNAKAKWKICTKEMTDLVRSFHAKHVAYLNRLELASEVAANSDNQTVLLLNAHILYLRFVQDFLDAAGKLTCKGTHRVYYRGLDSWSTDWLKVKGLVIPKNFDSTPKYRLLALTLSEVSMIGAGFTINIDLGHKGGRPLFAELYIRGKQRWAQSNSRGETNEDVVVNVLEGLLKASHAFSVKLEDYLLAAGVPDTVNNGLGLRMDL